MHVKADMPVQLYVQEDCTHVLDAKPEHASARLRRARARLNQQKFEPALEVCGLVQTRCGGLAWRLEAVCMVAAWQTACRAWAASLQIACLLSEQLWCVVHASRLQ